MRRVERVLKVQPLAIGLDTAKEVLQELTSVARERVNSEFEQRLRNAYKADRAGVPKLDPEAATEDDFVSRNSQNADFRLAANLPTYENYVFLGTSGNVSFDTTDFNIEDLPKDIHFVKARADGRNGRFIEIQLKTYFVDFNQARNSDLNQILVQGEDPNWVNGVYEKIRVRIAAERLATRHFIYGNILKLFWLTLVLFLFAEYRIAKWLYPGFNLKEPLSGTGALVMFGVLFATVVALGDLAIPLLVYWFPYFEIEKNLSRRRLASRAAVKGIASAAYTAAILNVVTLVFGPPLARWLH
jgi:hypothetical protein